MPPGELAGHPIRDIRIEIIGAAGLGPEPEGDAVEDRAGGDGGDDRLQPAVDHDQPVDRAADEPGDQHPHQPEHGGGRRARHDVGGEAIGEDEDHADREIDAGGQHHHGLGHGHQRQQHALVGGGLHHIGGEACRVVADIDDEHDQEQGGRQQGPPLLRQPIAPVAHGDTLPRRRIRGGSRVHRGLEGGVDLVGGDVEGAGDQGALGDLVARPACA